MKVLDLGTGKKIPSLSPLYFLGKYCALQCGLLLFAAFLLIAGS